MAIQNAIAHFRWLNEEPIALKIGINTGWPAVVVVIGIKKFAYDVWETAVNMASRMESQGESGKIQIPSH